MAKNECLSVFGGWGEGLLFFQQILNYSQIQDQMNRCEFIWFFSPLWPKPAVFCSMKRFVPDVHWKDFSNFFLCIYGFWYWCCWQEQNKCLFFSFFLHLLSHSIWHPCGKMDSNDFFLDFQSRANEVTVADGKWKALCHKMKKKKKNAEKKS